MKRARLMQLPNYFIADLPPEVKLTPAMLQEACASLKHNREHYLPNLLATHKCRRIHGHSKVTGLVAWRFFAGDSRPVEAERGIYSASAAEDQS